MKFVFLDLEAIPETKEIVSVGACYDDKEFYFLVKPTDVNMLNEHVSKLTGLTKEDLSKAPELKDVLDSLFSWLPEEYRVYVYGKFDRPLLKKARENSKDERLDFFVSNTFDVAPDLTKLLVGDTFPNALKKLAQKTGYDKEQNHNALDDAKMLRYVFEYCQSMNDFDLTLTYFTNRFMFTKQNLEKGYKSKYKKEFEKYNEFVETNNVREFLRNANFVGPESSAVMTLLTNLRGEKPVTKPKALLKDYLGW